MDDRHAKSVAEALGGEAWHSGGGIWLVLIRKENGLVVISDEAVCEYASMEDFESGHAITEVILA